LAGVAAEGDGLRHRSPRSVLEAAASARLIDPGLHGGGISRTIEH
jgi:hypothetical protein